jgi:tRNA A-37 threonylcarbamoyl transferase component Bud32
MFTDERTTSRTDFFGALGSIHNAGYNHNNLMRKNLVLNEVNMSVSIVGLGYARPAKSEHGKREELESLLRLLPNPLKRSGDGNHTLSFLDMYLGSGYLSLSTRDDSDASPTDAPHPKKLRDTL